MLLDSLVNTGLFCDEISAKLEEIANCIDAELLGRHEWGISAEMNNFLYCGKKEFSDSECQFLDSIDDSLRFIPCKTEQKEIFDSMKDEYAYEGINIGEEEVRNIMLKK